MLHDNYIYTTAIYVKINDMKRVYKLCCPLSTENFDCTRSRFNPSPKQDRLRLATVTWRRRSNGGGLPPPSCGPGLTPSSMTIAIDLRSGHLMRGLRTGGPSYSSCRDAPVLGVHHTRDAEASGGSSFISMV